LLKINQQFKSASFNNRFLANTDQEVYSMTESGILL